ncbi:U32 family peptidase [Oscillospiraceae bacterium OttesenSCG-928-F05]|nr:U32 family peptidase [Oscillospiraceae bacterium OttesenSCG-928-F05]
MKKPELLAPAGGGEQLEAAIRYGADAVYLGGKAFGMRSRSENFDPESLEAAVALCHSHGVKLYVTCNTLPLNRDIESLGETLRFLGRIGADAVIVADIGVLRMAKREAPELEVHISTQMGVTNWQAARELHALGASRVIPARELSLDDLKELRDKTPPGLEIEAFVHGAMCVSFSGRCLISQYLTGRDANRGECAQPCRWNWRLVEEKRPGQYFPVTEDEGTYFFNAQDMCMLPHVDKLAAAGVGSFKIEGRAKSAYYTAVTTNAYRCAIDRLGRGAEFALPAWLLEEPEKVRHRAYCTGFYFPEGPPGQHYSGAGYVEDWKVVALVEGYADGNLLVSQRNVFGIGETLEVLEPGEAPGKLVVGEMTTAAGEPVSRACHPMELLKIPGDRAWTPGAFIRRRM